MKTHVNAVIVRLSKIIKNLRPPEPVKQLIIVAIDIITANIDKTAIDSMSSPIKAINSNVKHINAINNIIIAPNSSSNTTNTKNSYYNIH
jgi:hypothetical protein